MRTRQLAKWSAVVALVGALTSPAALIAWYKFDEGSGSSTANSGTAGSSGNLSFQGSATFSPAGESPAGTGYSLDNRTGSTMGGSGGGAQTAASFDALDSLTAMTITGWYKSDGAIAGLARLVDRADASVGAGQWSLYFDPTPGRLQLNLGGTTFFNTSGDYWVTNTWMFFAVRFIGGSSVSFFVGDTATSATLLTSAGGTVPADLGDGTKKLTVGNRENLGRAFKGFLDDVRIYDEAISDTGIEDIRVAGIPEPGTIGLLGLSAAVLMVFRRRSRVFDR